MSYTTLQNLLSFLCMDLNTLCQKNEFCITDIHPSGTLCMEIAFEEVTMSPMVIIMYAFNTAYLLWTKIEMPQ